jgi:hypothetical protein
MGAPNRVRYEVLRRDGYTCRYCGAKAPDVELDVDAVVPGSLGGSHKDPANLVTACKACNNGKSSSSPDAPLVAEVSEVALQWAQAVRQAQAGALADLEAREADRRQFAKWWDGWTYEHDGERRAVDRPADWEHTVDQLVSAGLPMPLLKECISRAMGRERVRNSEKFRYMCGVAWRKLAEIQEAARSIASAPDSDGSEELDPNVIRGRSDLACELLGIYHDADERDRLLTEAREDRGAETVEEQQTEAAIIAWIEMHTSLGWLAFSICQLLPRIPGAVIDEALHRARVELFDRDGPGFTRVDFAQSAADAALGLYEERAAAEYLDALPEEERAEWIAYAEARFAPNALTGRWRAINAVRWARYVKEWRLPAPGMCTASGKHIERCPAKATDYLQFAGLDCCEDAGEEHDPHVFCDRHAEMAVSGELRRNGEPVTVTFRGPLVEVEPAAVPF